MGNLILSKTKYCIGLQCPKLLWFHYNAKDQLPAVDQATQALGSPACSMARLARAGNFHMMQISTGCAVPSAISGWKMPDKGLVNPTRQVIMAA